MTHTPIPALGHSTDGRLDSSRYSNAVRDTALDRGRMKVNRVQVQWKLVCTYAR